MKKTSDTEQIRLVNRKEIVNYLRVHAPIARVDIGAKLGLSPATVTAITADLVAEGRIVELPGVAEKTASRGRPRVLLDLAASARHVLGVKLSLNSLQVMLGDQKGHIVKEQTTQLQTLELNRAEIIVELTQAIARFISQLKDNEKPLALGIAIQGVVNGRKGEVVWSPAFAEKNIQIKQPLEQVFDVPVTVANDANCLAIAVRHQPKLQHLKDFAVVMLGYGIGMGMVVNGDLYLGQSGAAAEFGHTKYRPDGAPCLCGKTGCIEAYVGDYAIYRDAASILDIPEQEKIAPTEEAMNHLVELADNGNKEAQALFERAGKVLGYGLANYIALMSPEKIIISGPGTRSITHMEAGIYASIVNDQVPDIIAETTVEMVNWNSDMTVLGVIALSLEAID